MDCTCILFFRPSCPHGVVAVGNNIHEARAVVEALEDWAKILTITKIFGGPRHVLNSSAS